MQQITRLLHKTTLMNVRSTSTSAIITTILTLLTVLYVCKCCIVLFSVLLSLKIHTAVLIHTKKKKKKKEKKKMLFQLYCNYASQRFSWLDKEGEKKMSVLQPSWSSNWCLRGPDNETDTE